MDSFPPGVTRAAVWTPTGLRIRDVTVPPLRPGELLVRVRFTTVCGSDLHTVDGHRPAACPSILGHEAVGDVVAAGADAVAQVGDRVVWSVTVACGRCTRCLAGRSAKCLSVRKVGHEPFDGIWALSGSYAEHMIVPRGTTVACIDDALPDAVAAPAGCATATVMAALDAAGDLAGKRVLICGAGMLGITAAAACAVADAHVQVTDVDPQRLELARHFGGNPDTGEAVDVAIDFSGATDAIAGALGRLDVGGVLVLAGSVTPAPELAVDPEMVVRQWLTITGVHNYEPAHLFRAVEFLNRTQQIYPWAAVVSAPVGLDAIEAALVAPPPGKLRASVTP